MAIRRLPFILLLVAALGAFVFSAAHDTTGPVGSADALLAGQRYDLQAQQVDTASGRVVDEHRRELGTPGQSNRLILFAIAVGVFGLSLLGSRRAFALDRPRPVRARLWLPQSGRAPPFVIS